MRTNRAIDSSHGDVADPAVARPLVRDADVVVHFAAETHVDRSIKNAGEFIKTDVYGTFVLLEAARENPSLRRFVQISTDEVYGSVPEGSSKETDELRPRNPDSAARRGRKGSHTVWATYNVRSSSRATTRRANIFGKDHPIFITTRSMTSR